MNDETSIDNESTIPLKLFHAKVSFSVIVISIVVSSSVCASVKTKIFSSVTKVTS